MYSGTGNRNSTCTLHTCTWSCTYMECSSVHFFDQKLLYLSFTTLGFHVIETIWAKEMKKQFQNGNFGLIYPYSPEGSIGCSGTVPCGFLEKIVFVFSVHLAFHRYSAGSRAPSRGRKHTLPNSQTACQEFLAPRGCLARLHGPSYWHTISWSDSSQNWEEIVKQHHEVDNLFKLCVHVFPSVFARTQSHKPLWVSRPS
jgi:hypothetical protein